MIRTAVLGLPRMGRDRELKRALEQRWAGTIDDDALLEVAARVRAEAWASAAARVDVVPIGDASLYDHVLDTAWGLGAIPDRFGALDRDSLDDYFLLARGRNELPPLELTKWFDTNYHYLVPELAPGQRFEPRADHWRSQLDRSRELGVSGRPVLLGPLSFLVLSKGDDRGLELLDPIVEAYEELLRELARAGAAEVQVDEPVLGLDRSPEEISAFERAFGRVSSAGPSVSLSTYFTGLHLDGALERVLALEPHELHLDLVRAPEQLPAALAAVKEGTRLSLGVVDGRNVWRTDLDAALVHLDAAANAIGLDRLTIATSCSLLYVPWSAAREVKIDPEVRSWLAFADEKLEELEMLGRASASPSERDELLGNARRAAARRTSARARDPRIRARIADGARDSYRSDRRADRAETQRDRLRLPLLPTTTIGSFPQTAAIRRARADRRAGRLDETGYERFLEDEIAQAVAEQEAIGLDVLVHGESERNDMVQYFAEQLTGFATTDHGWVQSYGSRCVRPPILFGDVSRPAPMTVRWWRHAQSLTDRPMKGMLTGPVTILQWSFVRDDQPRRDTCVQIALALQDEVVDLEAAGAKIVQIDEPALREGLPLRRADRDDYLRWATECFRLCSAPVGAGTQIHSHMCYSEFNEIFAHLADLDADVLSIEASRSRMEILDAFDEGAYPGALGPGVYDIHSPRVPDVTEVETLLAAAEQRVGRDRLWVNPDCGLKTRDWDEVRPSLEHLVEAARRRRSGTG